MKKGGFLRNVLDTIRSNQAASPSGRGSHGGSNERAIEFGGQLKPSHFSLCQVARHGFPEHPTSLAFDPVQKIAAIGTKSGAIRIFGRPGVDVWAQHEPAFAVTHMKFIINQGAIITVTADESIHLWSLRGPNLRLIFSSSTQGVSGSSPQASSPAPTPASNISSVSPQSGSSIVTGGVAGVASAATSSSSFLGQITDTVTGAVDSASDFLSGGAAGEHQTTPSPTSDARHTVSRKPEILHTLKFQREHITYIHQTLTSKWLYIGTERGNVHVANVETFELSGYSIAWNKAIELSRKTHPGSIIHISECPQDTNKLLIGYESGCIVIWDLKQRNADGRYYYTENLLWLAWHYEGKQFVAAHGDGSLITWQTRSNTRPAQVLHPHAKTNSTSDPGSLQHQQSITSSFARSLNNELYRPINKVEWKTSKSTGEPFYLFSGGLPYDGFDQAPLAAATLDHNRPTAASVSLSQRQAAASAISSSQQLLKASSASPGCIPATSPVSPNWQQDPSPGGSKISASSDPRQSKTSSQHKEKKCLRSTSLTVMYGKSITVLEMDDTIIDFITVCDNSPYENDTSDPYAVIVLLSNELILIDLTSSGYPSFDSPYPSANLNESPVTCVQYLADCSSDLIPFLYSTSQNVISRAPKKGFSDKEWPINGGEWGQSMQSYPELVLTGHADGTIKFWDMSGVNFDLISKIKTSKLFEKPNKPPNAILLAVSNNSGAGALTRRSPKPHSPSIVSLSETDHQSAGPTNDQHESSRQVFEEDLFAIEKIEFCSTTKRLLVAGACAQVIQFRLNKKDPHSGNSANFSELTTIMVEPTNCMEPNPSATGASASNKWKQHCLLQVKASQGGGASSSSGGSSSSSSSHRGRGLSGFQAELVCLTPLLISTNPPPTTDDNQPSLTHTIYCQAPPRITALAFQPTHNILAYAHEFGIVLIDLIQKCVIINATLNDLSGGSLINASNRDISIQPYATSSILQHHYQANTPSASTVAFATGNEFSSRVSPNNQSNNGSADSQQYNRTDLADNGSAGPTATTDTTQAKSSSGLPDGGQLAKIAGDKSDDKTELARNAVFERVRGPALVGGNFHQQQQHTSQSSTSNILQLLTPTHAGGNPSKGNQLSSSSSFNHLDSSSSQSFDGTRVNRDSATLSVKHQSTSSKGRPSASSTAGLQEDKAASSNYSYEFDVPVSASLSQQPNALSSSKQPVQSRYTNTMFQRQLSTNALNINAPPTSASSTSSSSATTKQGPRLFHRQMTASQLFTGGNSSSTSCQQDNSNMKRLLASSRADANLASSAVCLATASNQAIAAAAAASSGSRMKPGDCPSDQAPAKKTAKNKRIISRMLSISAIHTTVGSGSASSGGSGSGSVPATETSGLLSHNANNTGLSGGCLSDDTNQSNDATPIGGIDKFDSSFRRSRSSSTSSTTGHFQQQQQLQQQQQHNQNEPNQQQQLASESILCIAFLDPAQVAQSGGPHSASAAGVGAGSGTSQASASATNMTNSSSQAGQAGSSSSSSAAVAPGQVQSSAGLNHKSLSSIDNQQSGQLALWLGTSAGSVLLVCLQMPDNEDNRILQLQSISAEPIPRASIKLSGQILCIAPFTCEARLQPLGAAGLSGSAGAGNSQMSSSSGIQSASQSSSLEGDTHMQSPGSSASSCSASGGGALTGCPSGGAPAGSGGVSVAPSGGVSSSRTAAALDSPANVSFDSRSSLFIAIVGEKEARVYQVPPPGAAGSSSSSSRTAAGADHHHVSSHHHGHSSTQLPQQLQDSPLGNLLTNKRNLMATCELSDTSFACRSSVVQMRSPDESCLVSYLATGNIVVHSLPRLRPILMDADFVPYSSPRISSSMCMSRQGHCLYQPSVGEICKFTVSAQYKALVNEMIGLVYVPREMPEMPRTNFFKSLFSVSQSSRQSDRDELFGECSAGKPSRGVAKHIGTGAGPAGGPNSTVSGLDKLKGAAVGTMGHDVRMAREGLDERGEKLSEIEDRTLNMMNQSETYSQAAHQLAQKFKDKKWYQF